MKIYSSIFVIILIISVSEIFGKSMKSVSTFSDFNPFVVNGVEARIEDFPWHLGLIDLRFGGNICGASNIS